MVSLEVENIDYTKLTDQQLFGGLLVKIIDSEKEPEVSKLAKAELKDGQSYDPMQYDSKMEDMKIMLDLLERLKKNPVAVQLTNAKDKYPVETNYYASNLVSDLANMGIEKFWCKHPETLEFLYRHRHWYFITVEMCVNHNRKDMLDKMFTDFRTPEYIKLYETSTDIKAKFDLMACYSKREKPDDEFENAKIAPEFENEVLTNPEGIKLFREFRAKISSWDEIRLYRVLDIDFMKYPHLVAFVESECKRDPKDSFGTIISWDNLAAAEIHIRMNGTNWFIDIDNYKNLTYERMGINIAKMLKRELLVQYYNLLVNNNRRNYDRPYLSLEVLDYIGIAEVPRDMSKTTGKFTVGDGDHLWCGYRPDLTSREKYYQHIAKKLNDRVDNFMRNHGLFDYFVKDSKNAIESKSPNSEMYLKIQRHPDILAKYLANDIKPQFEITAEDVKKMDTGYGTTNLLRKLYQMGYREELRDLEHPSNIPDDNDAIFLTQVVRLRSNRYSLHQIVDKCYSARASSMRLLRFIKFGGKRDVHKNPTEDYQKGQNNLYEEQRYFSAKYFTDHQYN